nr:C-X-C motif chemokine 13 isoform X3 [Rattus norvegicus]
MRLCTAALLLLLAICLPPGHGILETHYTNLKCRCSKFLDQGQESYMCESYCQMVTKSIKICPKKYYFNSPSSSE